MNIILCGMPRSGKSTIGQEVAGRLGRPFIDTDALVQSYYAEATGALLPCHEIYATEGEGAFRYLEKKAIQSLHSCTSSVIAIGGGALHDEDNQNLLKSLGTIIYLRVSTGKLLERMLESRIPSFINDQDPVHALDVLACLRTPVFERMADVTIAAEETSVSVLAETICGEFDGK